MNPIEISVNDHGPLRVSGTNIVLKDGKGIVYDLAGREAISLCRCGHSANKPFCDGAHRQQTFQSQVTASTLPPMKK